MSTTSLYQKYRPQSFEDVVGQRHVIDTLRSEIERNNLSHAYLFSGPRGVGKTSSARLLAHAVNKAAGASEEQLKAIMTGDAIDVIEIDAASHTGVDNVRENIIDNVRVAPSILPWKVFIIDEVHMLSTSAFNALLKTLEEPPAQTMFILATTEIHKVPGTVISRCERFNFRAIGFDEMTLALKNIIRSEGRNVDDAVVDAIAKRSEGALRDAQSILGQVLTIEGDVITAEMAEIVLPHSATAELLGLWTELVRGQTQLGVVRVNRLLQEGVVLVEFTKDAIDFLRRVMLYKVQDSLTPLDVLNLSKQELEEFTRIAQQLSVQRAAKMVEVMMETLERAKSAAIPQLPLELAVIEITMDGNAAGGGEQQPVAPAPTPAPAPESTPQPSEPAPTQPEQEPVQQAEPEKAESVPAEAVAAEVVEPAAEPAVEPTVAEAPVEAASETPVAETEVATPAAAPQNEAPAATAPVPVSESVGEVQTEEAQTEETTPSEPTVTAVPEASGDLSAELVGKRWKDIVAAMKQENHALHLTLKVAQVAGVEGNMVQLGFEYQFYQDRVQDIANKTIIENVFSAVLGQQINIEAVIGKEFAPDIAPDHSNVEQPSQDEIANVWDLASASFGS